MEPIHKRGDKQSVKNYQPVSLLLIFRNIHRLIYNEIYSFFMENTLISPNQSGFKQGIFELISFCH